VVSHRLRAQPIRTVVFFITGKLNSSKFFVRFPLFVVSWLAESVLQRLINPLRVETVELDLQLLPLTRCRWLLLFYVMWLLSFSIVFCRVMRSGLDPVFCWYPMRSSVFVCLKTIEIFVLWPSTRLHFCLPFLWHFLLCILSFHTMFSILSGIS